MYGIKYISDLNITSCQFTLYINSGFATIVLYLKNDKGSVSSSAPPVL